MTKIDGDQSGAVTLVVAAALRDGAGRVLLQRRPANGSDAGLWEFPGGKVDPGETPPVALARELAEELGIGVDPADLQPVGFADGGTDRRPLVLLLYLVRRWTGEPRPLVADALRWDLPEAMATLSMPGPDYPLAAQLARGPA